MSEISCPLWSSVCEYQSVECAFSSPVSIEYGMLVTCRMQYAMFVSMMSLVLPMCILISCSSVLCVLMALGIVCLCL